MKSFLVSSALLFDKVVVPTPPLNSQILQSQRK